VLNFVSLVVLKRSAERTDYTYSASASYRSHNPVPKVRSPNMARRPLHGSVHTKDTVVAQGEITPTHMQRYYDSRTTTRSGRLFRSELMSDLSTFRSSLGKLGRYFWTSSSV